MRTGADEVRSPKYSHIERERRFLIDAAKLPPLPGNYVLIEDRYIAATRFRLRRMTDSASGVIALKLAKKYQAHDPTARPMVNAYLTASEYDVFAALAALTITKRRHDLVSGSSTMSIDVFEGALLGLQLAEIECADASCLARVSTPNWALREVSRDARFEGGALAKLDRQEWLRLLQRDA